MAEVGIFVGVAGIVLLFGFVAIPLILFILLQVFLCKRSLKLGLILPAMSFAMSLLAAFSVAAFNGGGSSTLTLEENGTVVEQRVYEDGMVTVYDGEGNKIDQYPDPDYDPVQAREERGRILFTAGAAFLVSNIPTVVFGGIWFHFKGRKNARDDLKRMQVEDLG